MTYVYVSKFSNSMNVVVDQVCIWLCLSNNVDGWFLSLIKVLKNSFISYTQYILGPKNRQPEKRQGYLYYNHGLDNALRASSLAFRAFASAGRASSDTPTCDSFPETKAAEARFPTALAAATALRFVPPLCLFFTIPLSGRIVAARSMVRFRKGLGKFSSSARSYSGEGR